MPTELQQLRAFQRIIRATGTILDINTLLTTLAETIAQILERDTILILVPNDDDSRLQLGAATRDQDSLGQLEIQVYGANHNPIVSAWLQGESIMLDTATADNRLNWLITATGVTRIHTLPLRINDHLAGVLGIGDYDGAPDLDTAIAEAAATVIENARSHSKTVQESSTHMRELYVLRQIDRELNDNIQPDHVYRMTLDWALRFTSAQAASIALYDQETDELRLMAEYGYDIRPEQYMSIVAEQGNSIAHRIARSGHSEIIPDVSMDKDFVRGASITQSQLSVPVMREDRVIAVITVDSKRLNGFTDEHVDFVEKLAARAGVAIDNARLFSETVREREKLAHILNNITDIVIASGVDDRVILLNPAAMSAFRLYHDTSYVGRPFFDVFEDTPLVDVYNRARLTDEALVEEITLANNRVFHLNIKHQESVGWIIVMHDITPFKEMDRLKSELIATVSHDLKQPLSVMNGYIELLLMHRQLDNTGISFIEMVRKSISNMRQLIDDLLDLAKIESGIQLEREPIVIKGMLLECVDSLQPSILGKNMTITTEIPDDLPMVSGDYARLQQIFHNLIGNAVKYTPPDGWVRVAAERRGSKVRIIVQDNGLGISIEDQAHIFDRFYRVRRPETDSIEGTGLGLAIVKSLVEAHNGQIGLESRIGEGTTFHVLLPGNGNQPQQQEPATQV